MFNAQNYEYTVDLDVDSTAEADNIVVGDAMVDFNGKDYEFTFIDPTNRFTVACRVKEVHLEAIAPALGSGSIYEPTDNVRLFQGTPISDPSRTVVRNRDNFVVDAKIKEIEDQLAAAGSGSVVQSNYDNSTGSGINALTAVSTDSSGNLKVCNPGVEADVLAYKGITVNAIPDASSGDVAKMGLVENITTAFALQADLYVAKDGSLTDSPPAIGVNGFVAGDFVIYVGHISRNEITPANKDLELKFQIMGQL